jgi:hypothetical protein
LSSRGWVWEPSYYEFYRSSFSDSCPHWLPAQLYVDVCHCSGVCAIWFSYLTSQLFTRVGFVDDHHPVSILETLLQLHYHIPVLSIGIDNQTLAPALGSSFFLRQLLSSDVRNEHLISPSQWAAFEAFCEPNDAAFTYWYFPFYHLFYFALTPFLQLFKLIQLLICEEMPLAIRRLSHWCSSSCLFSFRLLWCCYF